MKAFTFSFYIFAVLGIGLFVFAYLQSYFALRKLHMVFNVGLQSSKECGYEYMEKESGIHYIYQALNDPIQPLQKQLDKTLEYLLYTIALLSICVLMVVLYYFAKQPDETTKNFAEEWKNMKTGWLPAVKIGVYVRYLLIPTILVLGLLFYYNKQKQLYIPDYDEQSPEQQEEDNNADPEVLSEKKKKEARDVDSTIQRQMLVFGGLAARMLIMRTFYVPSIPIAPAVLGMTDMALIMSLLLLMTITRFNSELQNIIRVYARKIGSLNNSIANMMESPAFRDYYVKNAQRMEKNQPEQFMEHHIHQLAKEGNLHLYLEHHRTANHELEFMKKIARSEGKAVQGKKITWSPVVNRIRADMNSLRQSQEELEEMFKKNGRNIVLIFSIPIFIILYILFHKYYKSNPQRVVNMVVGTVLLITIYIVFMNYIGLVRA